MAIKIRLAMHGLRNNRFFHLVAIDHRKARNAKPTELLGIYKPGIEGTEGKKTLEWSANRIKYWLNVGAVPSKSVVGLLERGGILRPGSPFHRQAAPPLIAPATPQPVEPVQAKAQGRVAPKAKVASKAMVASKTTVASKAKGASKAPKATQAKARST